MIWVVVVFDKYDEENVSYIMGPFTSLTDAQDAAKARLNFPGNSYRRYTIQRLYSDKAVPQWELLEAERSGA